MKNVLFISHSFIIFKRHILQRKNTKHKEFNFFILRLASSMDAIANIAYSVKELVLYLLLFQKKQQGQCK